MRRFFILILACCASCTSVPTTSTRQEVRQKQRETTAALKTVAGTLSGKEINDEDLKNLAQRMETDKETKSAVQALTGTIVGAGVVVKYCPVDGKRFSGTLSICPEHHVELKRVE